LGYHKVLFNFGRSINRFFDLFKFPLYFILFSSVVLFTNCTRKKSELVWETNLYAIGSQSSLRTADLNGDGVLDIVIGAAKNEYQHNEQGILAINGATGKVLWRQEASDQVFGSATFNDITGDGVQDVFISGRSRNLKALDGTDGRVIWDYSYRFEHDSILQYARFNFYNSVLVPDQNRDGIRDLLVVNGGNSKVMPYTEKNRFPGVLMVFDSKTGYILAADTMPDGKESYMSPVCFSQPGSDKQQIVFGTGGETISGNLYLADLADLMANDLSGAKVLASETGHGFIAPPVLADISGDGFYDIVAISHASTIVAIDGITGERIWETNIPGTESSNSFAVGNFTGDQVPDFFTFVSKGVWPGSTTSIQIMLDGKNGHISYQDSLGCVTFSSPVAYDLDGDGIDEAIMSYNEFDCYRDSTNISKLDIENKLVAVNFAKNTIIPIDQKSGFKNIFSTPWIGDLDGDGYLDIVYSQCYSPNSNILSFLGMNIKRISTNISMNKPPVWGGYMGSNGDGVYSRD